MTSKERVRKAICFQGPDKVPHFLPDDKENDLFWAASWNVGGNPGNISKKPWTDIEGTDFQEHIDAWGVVWHRHITDSGKGEAKEYPIADIAKQAEYKFPDLNHPAYFDAVKKVVQDNEKSDNPKYILGVAPFATLNEGTHNIRGLQNMFMDYYTNADDLKALIGRLADKQAEGIRCLAKAGCDGVMFYDDWGLQDRLMVSPDLIEEFFMPFYRRNWQLSHELGMENWMHSCGYIIEMLPVFAEAGLNVAQIDQQENMGLENLAEQVGGKVAFWAPVDIQKTMIEGSLDDIKAYVKRMISTIGSFNGGLVSMAYTTPEDIGHTPEKIAAMCEAFREYGIY
ncbi:MAG: uroporphyrinogen decarboxylase family protein [Sedimentisphaeraceae bacterium JB056]